ncbi:hypothetical protein PS2_0073 [Aeromonas phage PS2]|uniref:Uncharacterized protein n=1 Tax=Aeromonas phage PS1 TaxID=2591406 RepID=A0A514TUY5_9CAUD|nr:hypothetical protein PQC64_gp188 [Aeromonas phage PS1]QDJ96834.1 hypothetical protein PS1_0075 [Aeromonas phage PS1]QFR59464.1 hypothetical protein PS2_0073 [Aeromonas phage PS2]
MKQKEEPRQSNIEEPRENTNHSFKTACGVNTGLYNRGNRK